MSEFLDKHTLFDNNTIRVIEPFVLYSYVDDDNVVVWDEDISDNEDWSMVNKKIELYARTCYKSEDRITVESADKFVKHLHSRHHDGALEHVTVTVKLFCSRAASHQIVRHRLASYLQESQRYCNYGKDDKLVVVAPEELYTNRNFEALNEYVSDMAIEYGIYKKWLAKGWNTEDSRYFLPAAVISQTPALFLTNPLLLNLLSVLLLESYNLSLFGL